MNIKKTDELLLWQMAYTAYNTNMGVMNALDTQLKELGTVGLSKDNSKAKKNLETERSTTEDKMLKSGKIMKELENKYLYE